MARLAGFPAEVISDAKVFLAQAEMPLLRGGKQGCGLDSSEVGYCNNSNYEGRHLNVIYSLSNKE